MVTGAVREEFRVLKTKSAIQAIVCYPILALLTFASATGLTSSPTRPHTVLWPKSLYAYSILVPPGWRTQEAPEGAAFMFFPSDKSCAIVVSWVEFPEVPGRTTDSLAENAAAGAKIEHFAPVGAGTISGIKGKAYSGRLQADNSTWAIRSTYVQLRPTVWAIEVVKWRQTATGAQRAACTAASKGVTLNYH
jgi:hypothetical protein